MTAESYSPPLTEQSPLRIAVSTYEGPIDSPSTWSRAPLNLTAALARRANIVEKISYQLPQPLLALSKTLRRLSISRHCPRSPFFNSTYERLLTHWLKNAPKQADWMLHLSNYNIPDSLTKYARQAIYVDQGPYMPFLLNPKPYSAWHENRYREITRRYLDRCHRLLTMNEWTRIAYIEELGIDPERIVNVGFGANCEPYHGPKDYSSQLVLIVLRPKLEHLKGLDLLLQAWPAVHKTLPKARLAVVGTQASPVKGVEYFVNSPRSTTLELFQQASLYAMPAHAEVNGVVYPEALMHRTPLLGLRRYAFPEFAGHGDFGYIVEKPEARAVSESLIHALSHPSELEQKGSTGQTHAAKRFTWQATTARIVAALHESAH